MSSRRLSGREFEILVTLVEGPRHGYAIMRELRESGGGEGILGPGTLYRVLKDLVGRGLITLVERRETGVVEGPPRRYYRLTATARRLVADEAVRLEGLLARARPLLNDR